MTKPEKINKPINLLNPTSNPSNPYNSDDNNSDIQTKNTKKKLQLLNKVQTKYGKTFDNCKFMDYKKPLLKVNCLLLSRGFAKCESMYYICECDPDKISPICSECFKNCHKNGQEPPHKEIKKVTISAICSCGYRSHRPLSDSISNDITYRINCTFGEVTIIPELNFVYQVVNEDTCVCLFCYNVCYKRGSNLVLRNLKGYKRIRCSCKNHNHFDKKIMFRKLKTLVKKNNFINKFDFKGMSLLQAVNIFCNLLKHSYKNLFNLFDEGIENIKDNLGETKYEFEEFAVLNDFLCICEIIVCYCMKFKNEYTIRNKINGYSDFKNNYINTYSNSNVNANIHMGNNENNMNNIRMNINNINSINIDNKDTDELGFEDDMEGIVVYENLKNINDNDKKDDGKKKGKSESKGKHKHHHHKKGEDGNKTNNSTFLNNSADIHKHKHHHHNHSCSKKADASKDILILSDNLIDDKDKSIKDKKDLDKKEENNCLKNGNTNNIVNGKISSTNNTENINNSKEKNNKIQKDETQSKLSDENYITPNIIIKGSFKLNNYLAKEKPKENKEHLSKNGDSKSKSPSSVSDSIKKDKNSNLLSPKKNVNKSLISSLSPIQSNPNKPYQKKSVSFITRENPKTNKTLKEKIKQNLESSDSIKIKCKTLYYLPDFIYNKITPEIYFKIMERKFDYKCRNIWNFKYYLSVIFWNFYICKDFTHYPSLRFKDLLLLSPFQRLIIIDNIKNEQKLNQYTNNSNENYLTSTLNVIEILLTCNEKSKIYYLILFQLYKICLIYAKYSLFNYEQFNKFCSLNIIYLKLLEEEQNQNEALIKIKTLKAISKSLFYLSYYYNDQMLLSYIKKEREIDKVNFIHGSSEFCKNISRNVILILKFVQQFIEDSDFKILLNTIINNGTLKSMKVDNRKLTTKNAHLNYGKMNESEHPKNAKCLRDVVFCCNNIVSLILNLQETYYDSAVRLINKENEYLYYYLSDKINDNEREIINKSKYLAEQLEEIYYNFLKNYNSTANQNSFNQRYDDIINELVFSINGVDNEADDKNKKDGNMNLILTNNINNNNKIDNISSNNNSSNNSNDVNNKLVSEIDDDNMDYQSSIRNLTNRKGNNNTKNSPKMIIAKNENIKAKILNKDRNQIDNDTSKENTTKRLENILTHKYVYSGNNSILNSNSNLLSTNNNLKSRNNTPSTNFNQMQSYNIQSKNSMNKLATNNTNSTITNNNNNMCTKANTTNVVKENHNNCNNSAYFNLIIKSFFLQSMIKYIHISFYNHIYKKHSEDTFTIYAFTFNSLVSIILNFINTNVENSFFILQSEFLTNFELLNDIQLAQCLDIVAIALKNIKKSKREITSNSSIIHLIKVGAIKGHNIDVLNQTIRLMKIITKINFTDEVYMKKKLIKLCKSVYRNHKIISEYLRMLKDAYKNEKNYYLNENYTLTESLIKKYLKIINFLFNGDIVLEEKTFLEKILNKEKIKEILYFKIIDLSLRAELIEFYRINYLEINLSKNDIYYYNSILINDCNVNKEDYVIEIPSYNKFYEKLVKSGYDNTLLSTEYECNVIKYELINFKEIITNTKKKKILQKYTISLLKSIYNCFTKMSSFIFEATGITFLSLYELIYYFLELKKFMYANMSLYNQVRDSSKNKYKSVLFQNKLSKSADKYKILIHFDLSDNTNSLNSINSNSNSSNDFTDHNNSSGQSIKNSKSKEDSEENEEEEQEEYCDYNGDEHDNDADEDEEFINEFNSFNLENDIDEFTIKCENDLNGENERNNLNYDDYDNIIKTKSDKQRLFYDLKRMANPTFQYFNYPLLKKIFLSHFENFVIIPKNFKFKDYFEKTELYDKEKITKLKKKLLRNLTPLTQSRRMLISRNNIMKIKSNYRSGSISKYYLKVFDLIIKYGNMKSTIDKSSFINILEESNMYYNTTYRILFIKVILSFLNCYNKKYHSTYMWFLLRLLEYNTVEVQQDFINISDKTSITYYIFDFNQLIRSFTSSMVTILLRQMNPTNSAIKEEYFNAIMCIKIMKYFCEEHNPKFQTFFFNNVQVEDYDVVIKYKKQLKIKRQFNRVSINNLYMDSNSLFQPLNTGIRLSRNYNSKFQNNNNSTTVIRTQKNIRGKEIDKNNLCGEYNQSCSFFEFLLTIINKIFLLSGWLDGDKSNKDDFFYDIYFVILEFLIETIQGTSYVNLTKLFSFEKKNKRIFNTFLIVINKFLLDDTYNSELIYKVKKDIFDFIMAFLEESSTPQRGIVQISLILNPSNVLDLIIVLMNKIYRENISEKEINVLNNEINYKRGTTILSNSNKYKRRSTLNNFKLKKTMSLQNKTLISRNNPGKNSTLINQFSHSQNEYYIFSPEMKNFFQNAYFKENILQENDKFYLANKMYQYLKMLNTKIESKNPFITDFYNKINSFNENQIINAYHNKNYTLTIKATGAEISDRNFLDQYLCVSFFDSITRTVYVQKDNESVSVIFTLNPIVSYLSKISKDDFVDNVDRSNRYKKLFSLLSRCDQFFNEIILKDEDHNKQNFISRFVDGINFYNLEIIAYIINFIINTIMIIFIKGKNQSFDENKKINSILWKLGILNALYNIIVLVLWIYSKFSLLYMTESEKLLDEYKRKSTINNINGNTNLPSNNENPNDIELSFLDKIKICYIVLISKNKLLSFLWNIIFSLLGALTQTYFIYIVQMIIIFNLSSTLRNLLESLTYKKNQLGAVFFLSVILNLCFALVALINFEEDFIKVIDSKMPHLYPSEFNFLKEIIGSPYIEPAHLESECGTFAYCFATHLDYGMRYDGGIGDRMLGRSYNVNKSIYVARFFYEELYFLSQTVILQSILFGIVIDTFKELRANEIKIEEDRTNICFICGIDKHTCEKNGEEFSKHITKEHNLWTYVEYILGLRFIDIQETNAINSYVIEKIQKKELNWFPAFKGHDEFM